MLQLSFYLHGRRHIFPGRRISEVTRHRQVPGRWRQKRYFPEWTMRGSGHEIKTTTETGRPMIRRERTDQAHQPTTRIPRTAWPTEAFTQSTSFLHGTRRLRPTQDPLATLGRITSPLNLLLRRCQGPRGRRQSPDHGEMRLSNPFPRRSPSRPLHS